MFERFLVRLEKYPQLYKAFEVLVPIVMVLIASMAFTIFVTAVIIAVARLGVTIR